MLSLPFQNRCEKIGRIMGAFPTRTATNVSRQAQIAAVDEFLESCSRISLCLSTIVSFLVSHCQAECAAENCGYHHEDTC